MLKLSSLAIVSSLAFTVGCGATPTPRSAAATTSSGNPLGPSYVLMPLPGEDDSLLGRVIPEKPEAGRSLEEVSRANPCAEHLGEKRESAVASSFEYAEELSGNATAGALLGSFGFSADARKATHFIYRLGTDKRVSVVDSTGYEACCAEKGCGYGYVSALIHGDGEYATGEESMSQGGVDIPAIGSASGSVSLRVLNKRKVGGYIAAVVTITDRKQGEQLGPLGVEQVAAITEASVGETTRVIYEKEQIGIAQRGSTWVFTIGPTVDGRETYLHENAFVERYQLATGSNELDDLVTRRNTGGLVAFGSLMTAGVLTCGVGAAAAEEPLICLPGAALFVGFGIPFFIMLGKYDGSLSSHYLTERDARLYVHRYNRAMLRRAVKDVEKAHRESALPPLPEMERAIGFGPSGLQGTF